MAKWRLAEKARLKGVKVSPHVLRHTFARNGGDPYSLKEILGHASITTTMVYVHLAGEDVKSKHRRLCIAITIVGIFAGDLQPSGLFATLVISPAAAFLVSPWYKALLGAMIIMNLAEIIFISPFLALRRRAQK